jgi:2-isopropylmalate synthase
VRAGDAIRTESEQGAGPVDALERTLRQCLFALYPSVANLRLKDYRVQTLDPAHGSLSRIRVNMEWSASGERWATAAVSEDLVEAAWLALIDGFRLVLMRLGEHDAATLPAAVDSSWAV